MTALTIKKIQLPQYTELRTLYAVYDGEELLCFHGMKKGYGRSWLLWPLKLDTYRPMHEGCSPNFDRGKTMVGNHGKDVVYIAMCLEPGRLDSDKFVSLSKLKEKEATALAERKHVHAAYAESLRNSFRKTAARRDALMRILARLDLNSGVSHADQEELRAVIDGLTQQLKVTEKHIAACEEEVIT